MASARKRSPSPEDRGNEITAKRAKTEITDNDIILWEWEDDGHIWKTFSDDHSKQIAEGFKNGFAKMKIFINERPFDIIFDRMVQRNSKTFWERRIRANRSGDDGGLSGAAHYFGDNEKWILFDHNVQRLIYAANAYEVGKVAFSVKGQKYMLDLQKMKRINVKTKKAVDISFDISTKQSSEEVSMNKNNTKKLKTDINKENESSVISSGQPKTKGNKSNNKKIKEEANEEKPAMKSISFKGKAPVDPECFAKDKYHVYYEGETIYDAMLNQTNLKNNNNKFYLMQILKSQSGFAVWFRWGRVGMIGQTNLISCGNDLDKAKEIFCKKFFDKSKNEFSDRKKFKKVQGKYDLVIIDYNATDKDEADGPAKPKIPKEIPESKLDKRLQKLIETICNIKEMENAIMEMKYDTKKAPLGKLTKEQIKAGYKALKLIDKYITNKEPGNKLIEACDAFYTRIPHCFGMQRPPVIRTREDVKKKIELLEALGDIEIAIKIMEEQSQSPINPIDQNYLNLNCELVPIAHDSEEFNLVKKYTHKTHGKTHNLYKMEVSDVFTVLDKRQLENYKDVGNKMLLWHGSRLTNWCGILSQGLRVAPPEAPVTGYMFGKGIYFADISSKSANYCHPTRSKNTGYVLLCEVSLGKTNNLLDADYEANNLPEGFHSTKGVGKIVPNESEYVTLSDGVVVPCGTPAEVTVENADDYTLNYNEYVVYNTNQIKSRYLVQLKFLFQ